MIVRTESACGVVCEARGPAQRRVRRIAINEITRTCVRQGAVERPALDPDLFSSQRPGDSQEVRLVTDLRVRMTADRHIELPLSIQTEKAVESEAITASVLVTSIW